jgi:P4 family phage/plasmid primase-like protien
MIPGQTLSPDEAIDACYAENGTNWQMYGSSKPGRGPYRVTHEVRLTLTTESPSASTSHANGERPLTVAHISIRAPLRCPQDWKFWCKRLSVRSNAPDHMDALNAPTSAAIEASEEEAATRAFDQVRAREATSVYGGATDEGPSSLPNESTSDSIERARTSIRLLADWRADTYDAWRNVGFALRNTAPCLVDAWHEFSARSPKYDRRLCQLFWDKLKPNESGPRLTAGSLVFWAQKDSPAEYVEAESDRLDELLGMAIALNNHTDWGVYVLAKMNGRLKSTPDGNSHAIYIFKEGEHRWTLEDDAASIKCFIKGDVVTEIKRLESARPDDADFKKLCDRAQTALKTRGFRDNVLMDIKESISDPLFRSNLDSNTNLIGWNNGVFDLESQTFRDGEPGDLVSMTCGHTYSAPDDPEFADQAKDFEGFMEKVHTNPVLRKYCLDALATCLSGKTIFEIMHTWTGTGSNGKTRMLNLMDMALGDYICTAPPSLLTGTRPDSGKATPELCAAAGARLLIMSEVDGKATINVAVMKELSGGEKIATRELYKKSTVMVPQFTMLLTCNDLSKVDSNDDGTWRRLKVLPFKSKFVTHTPGEGEFKADTGLDSRMSKWAPYVLSMLQSRYPQAVKDMATDPPEIKQEVMNYRAASDLDQDFLAKNMIEIIGVEQYEEADAWALLNTYRREGRDNNITLSKLQDKLARFGVPRAVEREPGRKVFPGWRLASHGRV